jgi:TatD DNase family protein
MKEPGGPAGASPSGSPSTSPSPSLRPIDSHCHLCDDAFKADIIDVVLRARSAGSPTALCILDAGEAEELRRAPVLKELWSSMRFSVGVHPMRADTYRSDPQAVVRAIEKALAVVPGACALGEMGLDYHYDFAKPPLQQSVFAAQVRLARTRQLPIIVHTREADEDTIRILRDSGKGEVRGVFHCFTGNAALAAAALELGFYISFSGIVSFPKSDALRAVAATVQADRLLIETDSPYLAPVPHRGKRNEPALVIHVAEALAAARRTTPAAIVEQTAANFDALFGKK